MTTLRFRSQLERPPGVGTWTFASIPATTIRSGGLRPRMRIVGTIDGAPIQSSLMPRGGGSLFIVVPQPIRERIGKTAGDSADFAIAIDTAPVVLEVPSDLARALGTRRPQFDALSVSQRKLHLRSVEEAKQPETRARRIAKVVAEVQAAPPRRR